MRFELHWIEFAATTNVLGEDHGVIKVTRPMTGQILDQPNASQKIHEEYISQDKCTVYEVLRVH